MIKIKNNDNQVNIYLFSFNLDAPITQKLYDFQQCVSFTIHRSFG